MEIWNIKIFGNMMIKNCGMERNKKPALMNMRMNASKKLDIWLSAV